MRILRNATLFLSLLMIVVLVILGITSFSGELGSLALPIIGVGYYAIILVIWKANSGVVNHKLINTVIFVLAVLPVIAFIFLLYLLSGINC